MLLGNQSLCWHSTGPRRRPPSTWQQLRQFTTSSGKWRPACLEGMWKLTQWKVSSSLVPSVSDDGTCSFVSAPMMADTMISSTSLPTSTEWWSRPRETGPRQKTVILRPTHLADSIVASGCTWIYIHPAILLLSCVASIMLLQHYVQMATRMLCCCEYTMFEG